MVTPLKLLDFRTLSLAMMMPSLSLVAYPRRNFIDKLRKGKAFLSKYFVTKLQHRNKAYIGNRCIVLFDIPGLPYQVAGDCWGAGFFLPIYTR
jgi:hypothetical protein